MVSIFICLSHLQQAVDTAPVVFVLIPYLTLIMNKTWRHNIPDHELAFKGGPNGETLGPVLQAWLHYDASRFRVALRAMFKQTDTEAVRMIRCSLIHFHHIYL